MQYLVSADMSKEVEKVEWAELWVLSQPDAAGEVFKLDVGGTWPIAGCTAGRAPCPS